MSSQFLYSSGPGQKLRMEYLCTCGRRIRTLRGMNIHRTRMRCSASRLTDSRQCTVTLVINKTSQDLCQDSVPSTENIQVDLVNGEPLEPENEKRGEGQVYCVGCTITFPSQESMNAHLPCTNTVFDLSKVKTETVDLKSSNHAAESHSFAHINIKKEIKSEYLDSSGSGTGIKILATGKRTMHDNSKLESSKGAKTLKKYSNIETLGTRKTQQVKSGFHIQLASKKNPTPTRNDNLKSPALMQIAGGKKQKQKPSCTPKFPGILPRIIPSGDQLDVRPVYIMAKKQEVSHSTVKQLIQSNSCNNTDLRISGVYYTKPQQSMDADKRRVSLVSVPVNAVVSTPDGTKTCHAASSQLLMSSLPSTETLPTLQNQGIINPFNFGSVVLGNNILSNSQQGSILLGSSGSVFNPLQTLNAALQSGSLIPGIQTMQLSQPLQNLPNFNLSQNHNILNQSPIQAVTSLVASGDSITNGNKSVGSISALPALPSNPVSQKVPVLIGNRLIMIDFPLTAPVQTGLLQGHNPNANVHYSQSLAPLMQTSSQFSTGSVFSMAAQPSTCTMISTQPSVPLSYPAIAPKSNITKAGATKLATSDSVSPSATTSKSHPRLLDALSSVKLTSHQPSPAFVKSAQRSLGLWKHRSIVKLAVGKLVRHRTLLRRRLHEMTMTEKQRAPGRSQPANLMERETLPISNDVITIDSDTRSNMLSEKQNLNTPTQSDKRAPLHNKICSPKSTALKSSATSSGKTCTSPSVQPPFVSPESVSLTISTDKYGISPSRQPPVSPSGTRMQSFAPPSSLASVVQQSPIIFSSPLQQDQLHNLPYLNSFINLGPAQVPYCSNSIGLPAPNFILNRNAGCGSVLIQNITNNQPILVGSNCGQPPVVFGSPMHETITPSPSPNFPTSVAIDNSKIIHQAIKIPTDTEMSRNIVSLTMEAPETMIRIKSEEKENPSKGRKFVEQKEASCTVKEKLEKNKNHETNKNSLKGEKHNKIASICAKSAEVPSNIAEVVGTSVTEIKLEALQNETTRVDLPQKSKPSLTEYYDYKTGLLQKQAVTEDMTSGKSQTETDLTIFFDDNKDATNPEKGHLFLGPLTGKELVQIVKNPNKLEKYINVPSGQILVASKAIAVPTHSLPGSKFPQESEKYFAHQKAPQICSADGTSISDVSSMLLPSVIHIAPKTVNNTSSCFKLPMTSDNEIQTMKGSEGSQKKDVIALDLNDSEKSKSNQPVRIEPLSHPQSQQETLSEKHEPELLKLSFVGDMDLLKDALRKSSVPLDKLKVNPHELFIKVSDPIQIKNPEETVSVSKLSSRFISRRKQYQQESTSLQNKADHVAGEKMHDKNCQKEWVPVEVVGDLTIRGKLLENGLGNDEMSAYGRRRSSRISAMPKLDYTDLECLPFQDLDENSDSDFESGQDTNYDYDKDSLAIDSKSYHSKTSFGRKFTETDKKLPNLSRQEKASSSKASCSVSLSTNFQSPNIISDIICSSSIGSLDHPASSESPTETFQLDIGLHNSPKNKEECCYSSESESDICDPSMEFPREADKKKYILKRHSEVTMFLIKHADKFHSEVEKDEHYCSICQKYKTNGIFSLAKHLKTHIN